MARFLPTVIEGLDVNEEPEGLVVYDPATDQVHYLNSTAAIVFTLCDGQHEVADIAAIVAGAFGLEEMPLDVITACLDTLEDEGLLQ